jgi:signal transduction histidine kinase
MGHPSSSAVAPAARELPVVVYAPTGRDALLIAEMLTETRHAASAVGSMEECCDALGETAGAVILTEEALSAETVARLLERLGEQPSWSDLPLILLTFPARPARTDNPLLDLLRRRGNATLLERPVQRVTLVSAVETALRARRRQYEVRDYLAERTRAEEQIRRAQRMDAVGKLAGGVAHEVNNMMTVVLGFGEFALRHLEKGHPARADLEEMIKAGGRAAAITQQLLAFSRRQHHQPQVLHLHDVVAELAKLLLQLVGAEYTLDLEVPRDVSPVLADRTQLDQILVNLVLNARDALQPGGRVTIRAAMAQLDGEYALGHPGVEIRSGEYVMLTVSDTGRGMTREAQERAFEPFFTTKPVGQGTGLGLSTVYGMVKQSDGYIWLYSELGLGTTVKIYLPARMAPLEVEAPRPGPARAGRETILVVEDEETVRRLARRALEQEGYAVHEAKDGSEALELIGDPARKIDLVLCDVVMPNMSGRELGDRIGRIHPGTPVLYMSGYTGHDVTHRGLIPPDVPFIQKPFTPDGLGERVREMLDAVPNAVRE